MNRPYESDNHWKGRIEERLDAIDDRTKTANDELARRLKELNHAHERSVEDREDFARGDDLKTLDGKVDEFRREVKETLIPELRQETRLAAAGVAGEKAATAAANDYVARAISFVAVAAVIAQAALQ